ncbi:hypothetical protein AC33_1794 [Escherichia coli 3-267-03_S3_C2]|nr:hypothetical protein AC33_1794 [Escherichia coli 3-267-03_S3_C2]BEC62027.1 hypothetical protein VEE55_32260 [Escherichia coli]GLB76588.1 hypothetical protein EcoAe3B3_20450 [Escherichia coli]DAW15310.1 MAG TPA: Protein of unknown function (DUF968) [Caudoviricetes sp.]
MTWLINSTQVKHTDGTHIIGIDKAAGAFICKIFRITGTVAFEEKYGSQLELIFRFIDRALAIGVLA